MKASVNSKGLAMQLSTIKSPFTPVKTLSGLPALWNALVAMSRKEITIMARYPVEFVASFGQVFLIVAVFTLAGMTFSTSMGSGGNASYSGVVTYGFLMFMFLSDTLWTIGFRVRMEQVQGTLEQLYLSPASKFASLVSRVVTILLWTGLLGIVGVTVMSGLMGSLPLENPLLGLYLFLMTLAGTFGVGFAFAGLTLRLKQAAATLANFLQFAFMILGANFFPFSALPEPVRFFSYLIPLSYGVDSFRSTLMGYPAGYPELAPIEIEIIIVTVFGLIMPFLGYHIYRRAEDTARRKGTLAEY